MAKYDKLISSAIGFADFLAEWTGITGSGSPSAKLHECADAIEALQAENERLRNAFNAGYLLACTNLVNMHDQPCMANDVLAEASITIAEVRAMNLSEYDAKALKKIRKARGLDGDPLLKTPASEGKE